MKVLSKTDFIHYLICPDSLWLEKNKPDLCKDGELSLFINKLIKEGYEVEEYAKRLFPNGVEVSRNSGISKTKVLLNKTYEVLFQPSFKTNSGALAIIDVLKKVDDDTYHLYEVKSSTSVKTDKIHNHIKDVCFQKFVLSECGIDVSASHIIHLNKDFIKNGDIDHNELLVIEDVTDEVDEIYSLVVNEINSALNYINELSIIEDQCSCVMRTRNNHCDNFDFFNKIIPDYNIYQLRNIREKKLNELLEFDIVDFLDLNNPIDFKLSNYQKTQYLSFVENKPIIEFDNIKEQLDNLKFPLHFFDYETYSSAVPKVNGIGPHAKLTFQVSIHTLTMEGSLTHYEYLCDNMDLSPDLVKGMKGFTGLIGTFISWHASFEIGRNNDMINLMPQFKDYLSYINNNMFDLEVIFKNNYIDYKFRGYSSLKVVLPLMCPGFSYDDENIQDGTTAMEAWGDLVTNFHESDSIEKIRHNLLSYCKKDSLAMVKIYDKLINL
tara:strand:- start:80 stop:1558 length:1479 start_codon:yes stop_codon:yes gene_type:complete